ncbi:hypothetical protein ACFFMP_10805 [Pseudoroseomonas cervicalis]|uniref:hypothetical protein n=1 Tax=Teichococcus cervicalis TaxID=204525 RepID=UPI0035EAC18E
MTTSPCGRPSTPRTGTGWARYSAPPRASGAAAGAAPGASRRQGGGLQPRQGAGGQPAGADQQHRRLGLLRQGGGGGGVEIAGHLQRAQHGAAGAQRRHRPHRQRPAGGRDQGAARQLAAQRGGDIGHGGFVVPRLGRVVGAQQHAAARIRRLQQRDGGVGAAQRLEGLQQQRPQPGGVGQRRRQLRPQGEAAGIAGHAGLHGVQLQRGLGGGGLGGAGLQGRAGLAPGQLRPQCRQPDPGQQRQQGEQQQAADKARGGAGHGGSSPWAD